MTTQSIISLLVLLLILVAAIFRVVFWPRLRIARIRKRAFPEAWQQTLLERLPFVARIPLPEKEQLQFLIKVFLADKSFYGCAGQEIDDDIRVTVAAQACLLILNQKRAPIQNWIPFLFIPPPLSRRERWRTNSGLFLRTTSLCWENPGVRARSYSPGTMCRKA